MGRVFVIVGVIFAFAFILGADYLVVQKLATKDSIEVSNLKTNAYFEEPTAAVTPSKLP